ncbi:MAG: hypothetical protein WD826_05900 [Actinomycetota bacterium]
MTNLPPEEIRRRIDEALAEIDEVEAQVLELFADIGGAEAKQRVLEHMRRAAAQTKGRLEK